MHHNSTRNSHRQLLTGFCLLLITLIAGCQSSQSPLQPVTPPALDNAVNATEQPNITGMLVVVDDSQCALAQDCGPRFRLLGVNLDQQIALQGDIDERHRDLIISAQGVVTSAPSDKKHLAGYKDIDLVLTVSDYRIRSTQPYRQLLDQALQQFAETTFGCEPRWDRRYRWQMLEGEPLLTVELTDPHAINQRRRIELTYHGVSGKLATHPLLPDSPIC